MQTTIRQLLELNPVSDIRELRYALGLPAGFDAALLEMADAGEVVLFCDDDVSKYEGLDAEYLTDGKCFFTTISLS
jgi:hypothetical protein